MNKPNYIFDVITFNDKEEGVLSQHASKFLDDSFQIGGLYASMDKEYSPEIDTRNLSSSQQSQLSKTQRQTSQRSPKTSQLNQELVEGRKRALTILDDDFSINRLKQEGFEVYTDPTNNQYKIIAVKSSINNKPYVVGRIKEQSWDIKPDLIIQESKTKEYVKPQATDVTLDIKLGLDHNKSGSVSGNIREETLPLITGRKKVGDKWVPVINQATIDSLSGKEGKLPIDAKLSQGILNAFSKVMSKYDKELTSSEFDSMIKELEKEITPLQSFFTQLDKARPGYREDKIVRLKSTDGKQYTVNSSGHLIDGSTLRELRDKEGNVLSINQIPLTKELKQQIDNYFKNTTTMKKQGGYLAQYKAQKRKYQAGGEMPVMEEEVMMEETTEAPETEEEAMEGGFVESLEPEQAKEILMMLVTQLPEIEQVIMQMLEQATMAEQPTEEQPMMRKGGKFKKPVFKKGGKLKVMEMAKKTKKEKAKK